MHLETLKKFIIVKTAHYTNVYTQLGPYVVGKKYIQIKYDMLN